MNAQHNYTVSVKWTGNNGTGTSRYDAYERSHTISIENKPDIAGSADTPFRGDATKYNPEDMVVSALSVCHMLWYLHVCADAGIVVVDYTDKATGILLTPAGAPGHFSEVELHPQVTITDAARIDEAKALHDKAHHSCFIANSVNFPVRHVPECRAEHACEKSAHS